MALKFNVFTGNFDLTGSGGGGGGSSVITGAVDTFADLPETLGDPPIDAVFLVREATGAFNPFATRRFAGLYIRSDNTGVRADDWTFLGAYPDLFLDGNFLLANTATPSKQAAFDLSAIASSTTRTLTVPDQNGTLALTSDITGGGAVNFDTVDEYTYTGLAPAGSATSASVWFIRRSEFNSAGIFDSTTTANNVEWDDRLTASYT